MTRQGIQACSERGCWRPVKAGDRCIVHGPKPEKGAETRRMAEWEAIRRAHREDVAARRLVREVEAESVAFYLAFPSMNDVQSEPAAIERGAT